MSVVLVRHHNDRPVQFPRAVSNLKVGGVFVPIGRESILFWGRRIPKDELRKLLTKDIQ
jgi:hypothetical protein